jgi:hypothetical protein
MKLGATAVQMGTAFLSCYESGVPQKYKEKLLTLKNDKITLTRAFSGKMSRGIKNKFITLMEPQANHILDYPIQNVLTRALRKEAEKQNNSDFKIFLTDILLIVIIRNNFINSLKRLLSFNIIRIGKTTRNYQCFPQCPCTTSHPRTRVEHK